MTLRIVLGHNGCCVTTPSITGGHAGIGSVARAEVGCYHGQETTITLITPILREDAEFCPEDEKHVPGTVLT